MSNKENNTSFTLGTRYDYNSYFGYAISPRIAIVSQPNDQWTFKLQAGSAFRAPTENEIIQTPADFNLKIEKIKTGETPAGKRNHRGLWFRPRRDRGLL